jgi:hypothetical protein
VSKLCPDNTSKGHVGNGQASRVTLQTNTLFCTAPLLSYSEGALGPQQLLDWLVPSDHRKLSIVSTSTLAPTHKYKPHLAP